MWLCVACRFYFALYLHFGCWKCVLIFLFSGVQTASVNKHFPLPVYTLPSSSVHTSLFHKEHAKFSFLLPCVVRWWWRIEYGEERLNMYVTWYVYVGSSTVQREHWWCVQMEGEGGRKESNPCLWLHEDQQWSTRSTHSMWNRARSGVDD